MPGPNLGAARVHSAGGALHHRARRSFALVLAAALAGIAAARPAHAQRGADLTLELRDDDDRRPRHLGRASLLTAGVLLGGTAWYWSDLEFNTRDWDLRWDWPSWKSKFTPGGIRLDQNLFHTNSVSHARAGWAHYQIIRGNGYDALTSVTATLATSVLWEYLVEFKEIPSLNDMVVNTTAGFAIGEPFYQLGEFLLRSEPTLFSQTVAALISPAAFLNDWIDGRKRPREATDAFGLTRETPHEFRLGAGATTRTFDGRTSRTDVALGLGAELVTLPTWRRPGRIARWTGPGTFNGVSGELALASHGVTGGSLVTRASILGHATQDFERQPDGTLSGSGVFVGFGSGFEYEDVGRPDGSDYLATMNILGPIAEFVAEHDGWHLRWNGELYGDFTMVKSLAYEGRLPPMTGTIYRPSEHGTSIPSVLGARGYYYALGVSAGTRLQLGYRGVSAGAELRADQFDSIENFDRFRDELVDEVELEDTRTVGRAWVGLRPYATGPHLATGFEWRLRRGDARQFSAEHRDTRYGMSLSFIF